MRSQESSAELEIRRRSQELATAWSRGRAAFVLDSLGAEEPLRAALIATLVHETLERWDRSDSKWPNAFRCALLSRAQGFVTPEELAELEREHRRRFGSSPARPAAEALVHRPHEQARMELHAERIRSALASGRPLARERPGGTSPEFLRLQPARR